MAVADTITLPAHWAPYLINGDGSGLNDGEAERIDAYLEGRAGRVVCMDHDSVRFTWNFDMHGGDYLGGDVAEYTILEP